MTYGQRAKEKYLRNRIKGGEIHGVGKDRYC
jgi:hypothetical protein